jgi:3-deoxy-manno-octulosonate cytidylyltransferase (CMP-KDO synthetase)
MRTLVVIPARLGAKRLHQKPLRDLAGRPLVVRVWERVNSMNLGEACVVATDDESVRRAAAEAGAETVMTSKTLDSGTDRVAEVARMPEFSDFDVFVNVQGDEPFMSGNAVAAAKEMVTSRSFDVGTAAARAEPWVLDDAGIVKVVVGDDGRALYFSRAGIPCLRDHADREARDASILQHLGVYVYTRAALERWVALPVHPLEKIERLEQLRPLAAGITFGVAIIDGPAYAGIDTEEDLADANARWAEISAK